MNKGRVSCTDTCLIVLRESGLKEGSVPVTSRMKQHLVCFAISEKVKVLDLKQLACNGYVMGRAYNEHIYQENNS